MRAIISRALPPLIRTPCRAARDNPDTIATGTARMTDGGSNDEHGDRADRITGPEPRSAGHDDRHAEKDHREAVRET